MQLLKPFLLTASLTLYLFALLCGVVEGERGDDMEIEVGLGQYMWTW